MKKMSIKLKLTLMFFVFIAIPILVLGSISYNMASSSMQSSVDQQLEQLVEETAGSIEQTINSVSKYVLVLSHNETLANAVRESDHKSVSGGDQTGAVVSDTNANNNKKAAFDYLKKAKEEYGSLIESLFITDSTGMGIISNDKENFNTNVSDREYVKKALGGAFAQSDVIISKTTGKPVVTVAYPITADNRVVGTLIGVINFENISTYAAKAKIGKAGYAFMIDKKGLVLYHRNAEKILKENIGDVAKGELKTILDKMKAGAEGVGHYTIEGKYKIIRYAPVNEWSIAVTADYDDYMSAAIAIKRNTMLIGALAVLIAIIAAYFMTVTFIIKPIKDLESMMTRAGNGDLTARSKIKTGDELQTLGEYFNSMMESQSDIIAKVRTGAEDLSAASEEMAASTEQASASTEQITTNIEEVAANSDRQDKSIVETSAVLVQLASLIKIAESKALTARDNSDNTMHAANEGRKKVKGTVEAIEKVNMVSKETAEILNVLSQLSRQVSGIIGTIDNISNQTNLLALNAAIEAARAGEHGKGFAVVADEVRKLAEQTSAGASEISELINTMVIQIQKAVESMDSGKHAVENGVEVAKDTDNSFLNIISAVEMVVSDIEQIADVTREEVANSEKIVELIDAVATIAETTASNSREVATAAEEQTSVIQNIATCAEESSAMAESLNVMVEKFII